MSVLIRGMEMPKNCKACVCSNYYDRMDMFMCDITNEQLDEKQWKRERHPNCPLVEIPTPHGRLIDVDGFKQDYGMGNECADCEQKQKGTLKSCEYDRIYSKMDFCQWLDNAETIIEPEGSE